MPSDRKSVPTQESAVPQSEAFAEVIHGDQVGSRQYAAESCWISDERLGYDNIMTQGEVHPAGRIVFHRVLFYACCGNCATPALPI